MSARRNETTLTHHCHSPECSRLTKQAYRQMWSLFDVLMYMPAGETRTKVKRIYRKAKERVLRRAAMSGFGT